MGRLHERSWTHNRSGWATMDHGTPRATLWTNPGAWHDEPDKVQWIDTATWYACLAKRNHYGAWCGYVGVPTGHRYHGVCYIDVEDVSVHGGLTYSELCAEEEDPAHGICHVPEPGTDPRVWWLGFDCAHFADLCPRYPAYFDDVVNTPHGYQSTYRTLAYTLDQCEQLASQLAGLLTPGERA